MLAMCFTAPGQPLRPTERPVPQPGPGQVLVRVRACGVCRTDLHVVDGELPHPRPAVVPGHEVVGVVERLGDGAGRFAAGDRVGVPWLGHACGACRYCRSGRENLCDAPAFTGYTLVSGYAEYALAGERYCFPLPPEYADAQAAPLMYAGRVCGHHRAGRRPGRSRAAVSPAVSRQ